MHLVDGRYKCTWCGADLDSSFADRETMEIISEHEDGEVHIIVVSGEEHHRCQQPPAPDRP